MGTYRRIEHPLFQAYDSNVDPLSGGLVYTYEAGTTTAKATYQEDDTENTNPVVLDSTGRAEIYGTGSYKFVLKTSAGVTIWTLDNIKGIGEYQTLIQDVDGDTKIQTEESADEDVIRFDIRGTEMMSISEDEISFEVDGTQIMYLDSDGVHSSNINFTAGYGAVRRPKFRWKDADEIYIGAGAYHHSGTSEQYVYWDSELTFALESTGSNAFSDDYGADGWHYIYIDDTAVILQASTLLDEECFLNSTTAPTWSGTKHGWYNGNDRCIFAVYERGDAIAMFNHDGGDLVKTGPVTSYGIGTPGNLASLKNVTLRMPGFSTKGLVLNSSVYSSSTDYAWISPSGESATMANMIGYVAAGSTVSVVTSTVFTNSTQIVDIWTTEGDASMYIRTFGWSFPVGM